MTARLIIIRHGNTFKPDEAPRRIGAKTDIPLTEAGIAQAEAIGHYLQKTGIQPDRIVTSPMLRTMETAEIIAKTTGYDFEMIEDIDTLKEIDYGPDENKVEADVIKRIGQEAMDAWHKKGTLPPRWRANIDDIKDGWIRLSHSISVTETVLAVSHGGIIRFAPTILGENEAKFTEDRKVRTASVSIFERPAQKPWVCTGWGQLPYFAAA